MEPIPERELEESLVRKPLLKSKNEIYYGDQIEKSEEPVIKKVKKVQIAEDENIDEAFVKSKIMKNNVTTSIDEENFIAKIKSRNTEEKHNQNSNKNSTL